MSELERTETTNPQKRIRWATRRAPKAKGDSKRQSIMQRFASKRASHRSSASASTLGKGKLPEDPEAGLDSDLQKTNSDEEENSGPGRTVYFNIPLPPEARDDNGHPIAHYARNKIRTAKYTPLSFIPKNLWFQFQNIANVYFLFIIILGIFSIFGASNPALNAVPLIVILTLTAIKDAIEDWGRTISDQELNNAQIHKLVDFNNVNTSEDRVSMWRKFKKANTRLIQATWNMIGKKKVKPGKSYATAAVGEIGAGNTPRPSMDARRSSVVGQNDRDMEMTPVPSPLPGQGPKGNDHLQISGEPMALTTDSKSHGGPPSYGDQADVPAAQRFYGSVINPHRRAEGRARFEKKAWKDVQVGDFVRLYPDQEIPADIIILSTEEEDGACYIETKNLDGETNLKVRQSLHCGRKMSHATHCERAEFSIESEAQQANLYAYSAVIRWRQYDTRDPSAPGVDMAEPISINNLLPRGSILKNTKWVLGAVVFTGQETKTMLNAGITPSKRAKISKDLNYNVLYNFGVLFLMCLVAAVVQGTTWGKSNTSHKFFEFGSYGGNNAGLDGFITFWAAIILFQNLVPISLYISLEIIRTLQAVFIWSDIEMYYAPLDFPCTPKSWNISDDLGQIEYIFSDKTGTLTQNVMEFKKATINGVPYGEAYTEAQAGMSRRQGKDVEAEITQARRQIEKDRVRMLEGLRKLNDNAYLTDEELTFIAPDFVDDLAGESGKEQVIANKDFMLALALCHTVITERTPGDPPKIEFKAQSPDEAALVSTAKDCGFTVLGRDGDDIILDVMGEERRYTVLNTLEFNSSRKRMSAIIRMPNGRIRLFCKGADSMIYSRLRSGEQSDLRKATAEHLEMFAREGLRTLCIAQRDLDEAEYKEWNQEHELAAAAVQNREEKLEEVSDIIERELTLLGGTAIEDRLQDGVPDAIALLGKAGIKLWVLTGDKVETAINIGFSCNLLDNSLDLIVFKIDDEDMGKAEQQLNEALSVFGMTGSDEELLAAQTDHEPPAPTHAVVIDGDSLKLVLDPALQQRFLLLCKQCKAVLCCRVSPSQKAAVVRMVKTGLDCLTLSIGDGANDVAMIQEAHIGVGIAGVEGRAAVMSSDYAIGQFRFLTRLLLVHGRWSYRRLAETIANFFYKNIVWTFGLFWYQIWANYDCSYIFDYTYIIMYNLAFTSLPVILMGVFDQDVSDKVSLAVPELYRRGIERKEWTQTKFWGYMLDGLYQSVIVWFFTYAEFSTATFASSDGRNVNDIKRIGIYMASNAVLAVNIYVLFNLYRWDWLQLLIIAISILLIWTWTGIYTAFTAGFTFYKAAPQVYGQLSFWALLLLAVVACLVPRFIGKSYQKLFRPRDVDIIREQITLGHFDYLNHTTNAIAPPGPGEKQSLTSSNSNSGGETLVAGPEYQMTPAPTRDELSPTHKKRYSMANGDSESTRPMYPPSVAPTQTTTHNQRSTNGSDGTDYSANWPISEQHEPRAGQASFERIRTSFEQQQTPIHERPRPSFDRPRPSFDRARQSMDQLRPSFEQSSDMTTVAGLMRLESSQSHGRSPSRLRGVWGRQPSDEA